MSVVAVYATTEVCKTKGKERFYAKLNYILYQCPCRDAFIVLNYFNAVTGTERCVGPHGSGVTIALSF